MHEQHLSTLWHLNASFLCSGQSSCHISVTSSITEPTGPLGSLKFINRVMVCLMYAAHMEGLHLFTLHSKGTKRL